MNMRISVLTVLLLVLVLSAGVAQRLDYNITGAGARAAGLGGAFIGVADDATAIVWNPAGLGQLERTEASLVVRSVSDESRFTDSNDPTNNNTAKQTHGVMNFASIAFPFKLGSSKAVIAVAYQRQLDFYAKSQDANSSDDGTGGVDTFSPAFAVRLNPVVSVGVGANIWFGKETYKMTQFSATPPDQILTQEGKPKGLNFIGGAMIDLGGLQKPVPLKFGVAVRTPFELTIDRTITFNPSIAGFDQTGYKTTSQMPLMLGFGMSVRPIEDLTLAVDYEIRKYGDKKEKNEFENAFLQGALGGETDMSASKEDLKQLRVGAEFLLVTRIGVFPLRAGFQTVPTLAANYDVNGNTSQVVGSGLSVGTGFISERFAIDVTGSMTSYKLESPDKTQALEIRKAFFTISGILYF